MGKEALQLQGVPAPRAVYSPVVAGGDSVFTAGERGHVDLALRSAIERGLVVGPRIITAARSLTAHGGTGRVSNSIRLDGRSDFRRGARAQLEAGAEWIKVMVSGGVSDDATVRRAQHLFSTRSRRWSPSRTLGAKGSPPMLVTRSTDLFTRLDASPATIARIEATREERNARTRRPRRRSADDKLERLAAAE